MTEHVLTVDVEDWFQTHNLREAVDRSDWGCMESRVLDNTRRLLDLFEEHGAEATFFVLGWVADKHPEVVREIDDRGHEIASHGYNHELLYELSTDAVREDIERSLEAIEPLTEQCIKGYRAPSFSITNEATDVLLDLGFEYDSSLFQITGHDRYGNLEVTDTDTVTTLDNGLTEVQLPNLDLPGLNIPWAGGGYFRVIPYPVYERVMRRLGSAENPFVFYLHPWEVDPEQPRLDGVGRLYRTRHYVNLDKTMSRLDRLLETGDWRAIRSIL